MSATASISSVTLKYQSNHACGSHEPRANLLGSLITPSASSDASSTGTPTGSAHGEPSSMILPSISYDAQLCPPSMPRYTSSPGFELHTCTSASVVSSATCVNGGTSFTGTTSCRTTISRSPVCFTT